MSLNICLLVFLSGTYTVPLVLGLAVPYRYMYIRVHYDNVTCVYIYIYHICFIVVSIAAKPCLVHGLKTSMLDIHVLCTCICTYPYMGKYTHLHVQYLSTWAE